MLATAGLSVQQGANSVFHPRAANRNIRYQVLGNKFLVILDVEQSAGLRSMSLVNFATWTEVPILSVSAHSTVDLPIVNPSMGNAAVFLAYGQDGSAQTSVAIHRSDDGTVLGSIGSPIIATGQTLGEATATQLIIHYNTANQSHNQQFPLPLGRSRITPSSQTFATKFTGGCPFTPETKRNKARFFDSVATDYAREVRSVPEPYVEMICRLLGIRCGSRVLELGCGTGTLAISLAIRGADVTAVDVSQKMISMARKATDGEKVRWINAAAEELVYEQERYDAIVSYESFHLFGGGSELLRRIHRSLRVGGRLGLGWHEAEWEPLCREHIVSAFSEFGSSMADWGYWTCPEFEQEAAASGLDWTPAKSAFVSIRAQTLVADVVKFLSSIERVSRILPTRSKKFFNGLHSALFELTGGSGFFSGEAKYTLKWICKQTSETLADTRTTSPLK